ncbi:hypothetical protein BT63DRAFT_374893 [Microthyrium microscopicum]|uniref:RRM domain-containing protein n=1 Tax=Microthyrium microscopicum TaxID=703497 RepID=A0A6A6U7A4_9PEZI|nr:hypothetical protein BT63DRAFT_374893 [Microthyrium microscopicum]
MATRIPFPRDPEQFDKDDRVSFDKIENKWILEDDFDQSEWEFNELVGKWVAVQQIDATVLERYNQAYAVPGVSDEAETAATKRKREQLANGEASGTNKRKKPDQPKTERKNTAVYVTGLPQDTDIEEVNTVFSKYGVIAEEIDSGLPRIKIYKDDDGKLKGDALVVYFRPESVALAIQMLDDTDFRFGQTGPDGTLKVKAAEYTYKKTKEAPGVQKNSKDKNKIIKKTQKLNSKLTNWDDEDSPPPKRNPKWDKLVILKHMFTLKELEEDPVSILDIKEDIREEGERLGQVTNVVLYDKEPEGIVTIRFSSAESAMKCVHLMDGRSYGGQKVVAYISDGSERFKKSDVKKAAIADDDDEEEQERLDEFGAWLEGKTESTAQGT